MSDDIHRALLESLLACLAFLEHGDTDAVDPDSAMRALEDAAHPLLNLSEGDRSRLVDMFEQLAADETDAGWQEFIRLQPGGLGLVPPTEPGLPAR